MFSFCKLLYLSCNDADRKRYDGMVQGGMMPPIHISDCCEILYRLHVGREVGEFDGNQLLDLSVTNNHEDCMRAILEFKIHCNGNACLTAAKNRNTALLDYLLSHSCRPNHVEAVCNKMARIGWLKGIQHLHQSDRHRWSAKTCALAAKRGRLDCLRYLHENGCPWDHRTTRAAAWFGRLKCLKYAHEAGCPWNVKLYFRAYLDGHVKCVDYAIKNGCPKPR